MQLSQSRKLPQHCRHVCINLEEMVLGCPYRFIMAGWHLLDKPADLLDECHSVILPGDDGSPPVLQIPKCGVGSPEDDVEVLKNQLKGHIWEFPGPKGPIFNRSAEHILRSWWTFPIVQKQANFLPVKYVTTPERLRVRRSFAEFGRVIQEGYFLPSAGQFVWVVLVNAHCCESFFQKQQLVTFDQGVRIGRVIDIFRRCDGRAPASEPVDFPIFATVEFGEFAFEIDNAGSSYVRRRHQQSIQLHIPFSELKLLATGVQITDAAECKLHLSFVLQLNSATLQAQLRSRPPELNVPIITFVDGNSSCHVVH
jgi:hypothetical protein